MPTIDVGSAMAGIRAKHPPFFAALVADAKTTAAYRAERFEFRGRADALAQAVRLVWVSDAFAAQALYRAKARMQALVKNLLSAMHDTVEKLAWMGPETKQRALQKLATFFERCHIAKS